MFLHIFFFFGLKKSSRDRIELHLAINRVHRDYISKSDIYLFADVTIGSWYLVLLIAEVSELYMLAKNNTVISDTELVDGKPIVVFVKKYYN